MLYDKFENCTTPEHPFLNIYVCVECDHDRERSMSILIEKKVKAISYVPSIELHFGCTALFPPMNVVWLFYVDLILDVVEKLFLSD